MCRMALSSIGRKRYRIEILDLKGRSCYRHLVHSTSVGSGPLPLRPVIFGGRASANPEAVLFAAQIWAPSALVSAQPERGTQPARGEAAFLPEGICQPGLPSTLRCVDMDRTAPSHEKKK
jgi:hypothetical protein